MELEHPETGAVRIREIVRITGRPYCSELTYKHPYHWDDDYHLRWDAWRDSGWIGDEPLPKEHPENQFIRSSLNDKSINTEFTAICPLCGSNVATWSHAYGKIQRSNRDQAY